MYEAFTALEQTKLWKHFYQKAVSESLFKEIDMVKTCVISAVSYTSKFSDTFPTYTLHNSQHSFNVVRLMGEILGPYLSKLTSLEAALLLLTAYYHDIGMVYSEEDKKNVKEDELFKDFVEKNSYAKYVLSKNKGVITDEILEWYCRAIHHKRCWKYMLKNIEWDRTDITNAIVSICESHGENISILAEKRFDRDFIFRGDIVFCSILLRLADILDFDSTRAPIEIYKYIGMDLYSNKRYLTSKTEWHKHMSSIGFEFPQKRKSNYNILYRANCSSSEVEHEIHKYLNIVMNEIDECKNIRHLCSERWSDFVYPEKIEKSITRQGYKYGNYSFSLDRDNIMQLFMGQNIYSSNDVFIRELIQNAIDTVRHREIYEKQRNNGSYIPKVSINSWWDNDGYQWISVIDNGMGMNENKIINYLLKLGKSFYNSEEFNLDREAYKLNTGRNFMSISRFGIGVVSCFLTGDNLEINTRHAIDNECIRMTLPILKGFYNLQNKNEQYVPSPMPTYTGNCHSYRNEPGTEIAVRINPNITRPGIDVAKAIRKYVQAPPVNIEYNGEPICPTIDNLISSCQLPNQLLLDFSDDEIELIEEVLRVKYYVRPQVGIYCIDLAKLSTTGELGGILVYYYINEGKYKTTDGYEESNRDIKRLLRINQPHGSADSIDVWIWYENSILKKEHEKELSNLNTQIQDVKARIKVLTHEIEQLTPQEKAHRKKLSDDKKKLRDLLKELNKNKKHYSNIETYKQRAEIHKDITHLENKFGYIIYYPIRDNSIASLSHNGIIFEANMEQLIPKYSNIILAFGFIALFDSLRPELTIDRVKAKHLSWNIISSIMLSIYKGTEPFGHLNRYLHVKSSFFNSSIDKFDILLKDIGTFDKASLLSWCTIPLFSIDNGNQLYSANDLITLKETYGEARIAVDNSNYVSNNLFWSYGSDMTALNLCKILIIQAMFDIILKYSDSVPYYYITNVKHIEEGECFQLYETFDGQALFPPLFFVEYEDNCLLRGYDCGPYNSQHPFCSWLINNANIIISRHPGHFNNIRNTLYELNSPARMEEEYIEHLNKILKILKNDDPDNIYNITDEIFISGNIRENFLKQYPTFKLFPFSDDEELPF